MAVRQYIGARYVLKFAGDWDNTNAYEALTVVKNNAYSYVSKQSVPTGVDINNSDFWLLWADPNAQMAELRAILDGFDIVNTVQATTDAIKALFPDGDFDSVNTVKKYIDDENAAQDEILPATDFDSVNTVKKYIDDENAEIRYEMGGDVEFFTQKGVFNTNYEADWFVVKINRHKMKLGINQNNDEYVAAWEATSSAFRWLQNHHECLFAHNCNFSGGETTAAVQTGHYAMRYEGINYAAGSNPPADRPSLAIDTENDRIAWYSKDVDVADIPAYYQYVFKCSDLLISDHVVMSSFTEGGYDAQRAAFAWDDDYYYIFYSEGRNAMNRGIQEEYIAALLSEKFNPKYAVNLDGGGSVCFAANFPYTIKINGNQNPTGYRGSNRVTTLNMNYSERS